MTCKDSIAPNPAPVKRALRLPPLREAVLFVADCLERAGLVVGALARDGDPIHDNRCGSACPCYTQGHDDGTDAARSVSP